MWDAVRCLLNRCQVDINLRHYMLDTESHALLIRAEAIHRNESQTMVRERRR